MTLFEFSPFKQSIKSTKTGIAKKQYQKLDNNFGFDRIIKKEGLTFRNYNKQNLICSSKYSFYK